MRHLSIYHGSSYGHHVFVTTGGVKSKLFPLGRDCEGYPLQFAWGEDSYFAYNLAYAILYREWWNGFDPYDTYPVSNFQWWMRQRFVRRVLLKFNPRDAWQLTSAQIIEHCLAIKAEMESERDPEEDYALKDMLGLVPVKFAFVHPSGLLQ